MKKFLVIGNPIDHSLSPKLHNYWINENNIKALYEKRKLNGNDLRNLISQVKEKNIDGINVTVPFKRAVIPFLDQLTDEAEKTQSVNTIYLNENKLTGHNTDIIGFEMSLKNFKYDLNNKEVFILGAGGVVPSIIFALIKMGASKIIVSNRTKEKVDNLKKLFQNNEELLDDQLHNICDDVKATLIWPSSSVELDEFKYDADVREGLKNKEILVNPVFQITYDNNLLRTLRTEKGVGFFRQSFNFDKFPFDTQKLIVRFKTGVGNYSDEGKLTFLTPEPGVFLNLEKFLNPEINKLKELNIKNPYL